MTDYILSTCQRDTSNCSIKDAFESPIYKYGTWVALLVMFWHEVVANNSIMLYSNKMLSDMAGSNPIMTPRQGTYLVGFANFFASGLSVFTAKYCTRRFLLVWGHVAFGLCHLSIGFFAYMDNSTGALLSMMAFVFFY